MWKKIKAWLLGIVEKWLLKEIDKLDKYEEELIELLRENINSEEKAAKLVKKAKVELKKLVEKAFDRSWLSSKFFVKVKASILKEVAGLNKYQDDIADLIESQLDKAEEVAPMLVNLVQDYLRKLVKKYIKKI
jgi:hypothetical protein